MVDDVLQIDRDLIDDLFGPNTVSNPLRNVAAAPPIRTPAAIARFLT